ncbi:hypothetical protein pEaSNUABM8_00075 [Erwinia phage pEa_SNUABM_8]|nr:hypothetical protein pEaSNUABM8_00075 [Erwinia phage pEa_SNUABM_8]QVW54827.1 hypothetical protein pEaSNUABM4_00074 [Erwinia phage pEa_SNUABM_4]
MQTKLQAVTAASLFDHLVTVKDHDEHPYNVNLETMKSWEEAAFYLDGEPSKLGNHLDPKTLFAIRPVGNTLLWSVYSVHDNSAKVIEKDGDTLLVGIDYNTAWPTEVQYLMSGTVDSGELTIEYCWGYGLLMVDDLAYDLGTVGRIIRHYRSKQELG